MPMYFQLLFALMIWHALADYPLQGDFLAKAKNRSNPIPGIFWPTAMLMHCLIHAGGVWLITGLVWLAIAEVVIHFLIDDLKCRGKITFGMDQYAHFLCKILYVAITLKLTDHQFVFFQTF